MRSIAPTNRGKRLGGCSRRRAVGMPSAATTKIHRPPAESNSNREGGAPRGCPDTPGTAKTPLNANAEAAAQEGGAEPAPGPGAADTAAGFLTANGQRDSHAVTLADGRPNRSPRAGRPYGRITWAGIRALVDAPAAVEKHRAPFVILSTYVEPDARTHAVQRAAGVFGGLAVDVDTGNPALADVLAAVRAVIGDAAAFVYSSASAAPDRRKWRVLVPLATPLAGVDYADTQSALFELLAEHGLECDAALARPGQPVYAPNVPPERRGPDGAPVFYQSRVVEGPALELAGHAIAERRDAARARRAALELESAERSAAYRSQRMAHAAATGDTFDAFEHFNANHTVAAMLDRYGFQPNPQRPTHYRHPESQNGSYATEDRGDHWVCLSAWAHTMDAGRATKTGHRAGDAFDLFVAFEHGGNRSAAVRAYAADVRPWRPAPPVVDAEPLPPPGRVEFLEQRPVVPMDELRAELRDQLAQAVAAAPELVVCNPGPGVGKSTAAVDTVPAAFDRTIWVVPTHDAAAETTRRLVAAGHDAAAMPPRDPSTCQCWTADDAARLREEYPDHPYTLPMEAAIRVGNAHMACLACPLSGLAKRRPTAAPVEDFAAWADPFADDVDAGQNAKNSSHLDPDPDACRCEYLRRKRAAEAARVTVMCHARFMRGGRQPVPLGTTQATVVDEHGTDVLLPRQSFNVATMRATRDAIAAAVGNWRNRKTRMRFGAAREREHELLGFGDAVAGVATAIVEHMERLETEGGRRVEPLPSFALPEGEIPKRAHMKLARLLVQGGIPDAFDADALELVRRAAGGCIVGHAVVYVEPVPGGGAHSKIVLSNAPPPGDDGDDPTWTAMRREMDGFAREYAAAGHGKSSMFVLDADADMVAIRRAFPGVVEIAPHGTAPLAVDAEQWWAEINPSTHPAVVVRMLELAIHQRGFRRCGVVLPKPHRDALFPTTRPRNGRPEDKDPDPERIANWGGRGGRALATGTAEQRLARARELVERVRHLHQFIARDEHGRLLVEHHHGAASRGTNKFLEGTDGGVVLGLSRCPPGEIAAYMLATGRGDAVGRSDGTWGDVAGELPAVGGGTTERRWRGYACPDWAQAAHHMNRLALVQVCERFRTRLATGVPMVVVAAEPTGLPVTDPPAGIPEGVAAVVGAVRDIVAAARGCEAGQTDVRWESGKPSTEHGQPGDAGEVSIGKPSTEHTLSPILIDRLPIETPPASGVAMDAIRAAMPATPERTLRVWLADAVARGLLVRTGERRWTRYALPVPVTAAPPAPVPKAVPDALELPTAPPPPVDAMPCMAWDWEPAWDVHPGTTWVAMPAELAAPPPTARAGPCAA